jgi:hypothetical protein
MLKIQSLAELGKQLTLIVNQNVDISNENIREINNLITESVYYNPWFTSDNVRFCLQTWAQALSEEHLHRWLEKYRFHSLEKQKNIGLVLAGNIPMVGFHDVLCVLLSGHRFTAKCASADNRLLPAVMKLLCQIDEHFSESISFTDGLLRHADAFIATGSNNSGRYFDFYFQKYPHIIRRNRNSVAILTGDETKEQLQQLGEDIFRYFGLGCRSVSKLFVPKDYDFSQFIEAMSDWNWIALHHRYKNNYDYHKAILLVNGDDFIDTGFFMLKHSESLSSPISTVFYETYASLDEVAAKMEQMKDRIQCVVSETTTPFGQAQTPQLWDYADGVDTMEFLLKKI